MRKIVFEYTSQASCGFNGSRSGDSLTVLSNGSVLRKSYVFGEDKPIFERKIAKIPRAAKRIEAIIVSHEEDLMNIPDKLHNGSYDGCIETFLLKEKKISALNICRTDIAQIDFTKSEYLQTYKDNMIHENKVLDIFDEIMAVLKEYDIEY